MASSKNSGHLPRDVARRIVQRFAQGQRVVVVTSRRGKPSRVFDLEKYLKMQELPKRVQPWSQRKSKKSIPEPLGAVDGRVLLPLTRERIYD